MRLRVLSFILASRVRSSFKNSAPRERHNRAHGAKPWVDGTLPLPFPHSRSRGRGVPKGVRALGPRAAPWAKILRPLTGLWLAPVPAVGLIQRTYDSALAPCCSRFVTENPDARLILWCSNMLMRSSGPRGCGKTLMRASEGRGFSPAASTP